MGPFGKSLGAMGKMGKSAMAADESDEPMDSDMDMDEPEADEESSGVPPEFQSAYDEYNDNPTAETMYAMISACQAGGGDAPKADGLLLIPGGKGKK